MRSRLRSCRSGAAGPGKRNRDEAQRNPDMIAATFRTHNNERMTVRYDLLRERGTWKIDDIRGTVDGKEWSIRKLLREEP